jgi:hypothetical protein
MKNHIFYNIGWWLGEVGHRIWQNGSQKLSFSFHFLNFLVFKEISSILQIWSFRDLHFGSIMSKRHDDHNFPVYQIIILTAESLIVEISQNSPHQEFYFLLFDIYSNFSISFCFYKYIILRLSKNLSQNSLRLLSDSR